MKIFPAIDIKDKKCVRLIKGNFENKTEYEMSPVDQAQKYKDHGFKNLQSNYLNFLSNQTQREIHLLHLDLKQFYFEI